MGHVESSVPRLRRPRPPLSCDAVLGGESPGPRRKEGKKEAEGGRGLVLLVPRGEVRGETEGCPRKYGARPLAGGSAPKPNPRRSPSITHSPRPPSSLLRPSR